MIREAIIKLSKKEDLTYDEAESVMNEIMDGAATPVQMASYLTALSMKGETIDEITASAAGMRAHCIKLLHDMDVLEIVGTGGDGANSFNISTTSSLVIAAGGVPVAKHGNRAASSKSGAADVLEALGVKITIPPEKSAEILKKINICFLFAQNYHIAMKYVAPIRKELGIRTVFNILGPLSNPAGANMELMGVFDQSLVEPLAQVMMKLGVNRGMVVFGQDKLDEISMSAPTSVCEIKDGWFQSYEITPEQFGYTRCSKEELAGGTPAENAEITKAIVNGTEKGPKRQAVCMNAGAALYIAGKAESLEAGVKMAENLINMGIDVKLIEKDRKRCDELSILLPKAIIINGDGTDQELLMEEGIERAESFVPLTGIDEENIMLNLFAKQVSEAKVITKINRMTFKNVIGKLDLGSVIYPRIITSEAIIAYVRAKNNSQNSNIETLYHMFDSRVEAIEVRVDEASAVTSKTLSELRLKKNLLVCSIYRRGKVIIPSGQDQINLGDTVIVVTTHKRFNDIKDILEK